MAVWFADSRRFIQKQSYPRPMGVGVARTVAPHVKACCSDVRWRRNDQADRFIAQRYLHCVCLDKQIDWDAHRFLD